MVPSSGVSSDNIHDLATASTYGWFYVNFTLTVHVSMHICIIHMIFFLDVRIGAKGLDVAWLVVLLWTLSLSNMLPYNFYSAFT